MAATAAASFRRGDAQPAEGGAGGRGGDVSVLRLVDDGEALLEDVVKKEIREIEAKKQRVFEELMHVKTLMATLRLLRRRSSSSSSSSPLEALVNVGCDSMMQAEVDDPSQLFVSVGFGFFLQMTTAEASIFLEKKQNLLERQMERLMEKNAEAKVHAQTLLDAISDALTRGGGQHVV